MSQGCCLPSFLRRLKYDMKPPIMSRRMFRFVPFRLATPDTAAGSSTICSSETHRQGVACIMMKTYYLLYALKGALIATAPLAMLPFRPCCSCAAFVSTRTSFQTEVGSPTLLNHLSARRSRTAVVNRRRTAHSASKVRSYHVLLLVSRATHVLFRGIAIGYIYLWASEPAGKMTLTSSSLVCADCLYINAAAPGTHRPVRLSQ